MVRLDAHNFVSPASFRVWLDCDEDDDLAPTASLISRLAAVSRLDVPDLRRLFGVGAAPVVTPLAVSQPSGIRGAACTVCCRNAAQAGGDHFVSAVSASLWRVSCPEHRAALADLDGYDLVERSGRCQLVHERAGITLGLVVSSRPAELILAFEDTIAAVLQGRPPGPAWLARTAASFLASVIALVEVVLWRRLGQAPFSHEFDPHRAQGCGVLSVEVDERRAVLDILAEQGPQNRMNVFAAVATLLTRPGACDHPLAVFMGWNRRDSPGPYAYLLGDLDHRLRAAVTERLEAWPACIATPARRGLGS